ncbi:NAD(P)H-binding protein [Nocardia asteroides]|uniref:NAD(P)H-binding protein n=1 Tax=Nocardia asteroides TaxID=1824 RepID=UPI001E515691|nr:NAD(P)H-binding protein [Nocardia asteroides]UGT62340.1 NAD(P)H-binding protein [Nocardia asteroides]
MIVVTGATGNVGAPLVRALTTAGARVTGVSRGAPADPVPGVTYRQADLIDPESLPLDGATGLFLLTAADFLASGTGLTRTLERAAAAGARRVVLLSSQGVRTGRHPAQLEAEVFASGLEWTVLRPGGFASNALQWAESVRAHRTVAAPFADVALPVVDPGDIAAMAAAALLTDGHAGQRYELTGPAAITPREQAAALAAALGEPLRFLELTRAEAAGQLSAFMPAPVAEATLDILGSPTPEEQRVNPDIERVLGRPAASLAEWAARSTAAFR